MPQIRRKGEPEYRDYIHSEGWRDKQKECLIRGRNRCAMFPWVTIGKSLKGQYRPYRVHHLHYGSIGKEKFWWDILPLCPVAHDWIIHGIFSGFRSAGKQASYPNRFQQGVHLWCRMPDLFKGFVVLGLLVGAIAVLSVGTDRLPLQSIPAQDGQLSRWGY